VILQHPRSNREGGGTENKVRILLVPLLEGGYIQRGKKATLNWIDEEYKPRFPINNIW